MNNTTNSDKKKKGNGQWQIYEAYVAELEAVKGLNPLYVITFDGWMKEALPEVKLSTLQKAKILLLTHALREEFNGE